MKRLVVAILIATAVGMSSAVVRADEQADSVPYEDAITHPLRLAFYAAHPVGFTAEWLVFRPFHYVISRPYLERFFGYEPLEEESSYRRLGEHM